MKNLKKDAEYLYFWYVKGCFLLSKVYERIVISLKNKKKKYKGLHLVAEPHLTKKCFSIPSPFPRDGPIQVNHWAHICHPHLTIKHHPFMIIASYIEGLQYMQRNALCSPYALRTYYFTYFVPEEGWFGQPKYSTQIYNFSTLYRFLLFL